MSSDNTTPDINDPKFKTVFTDANPEELVEWEELAYIIDVSRIEVEIAELLESFL